VLAWVDTPQVARASDLFAVGVEEIIVRDAGAPESMLARLDVIDRRPGRPVPPLAAEGITARSPSMRACLERVAKAQRSEATVLLQGETGTGKEVLARMIHAGGRRATGPFVAINCAAFPETLLESELFGYERGAFTGADRSKRGHFEQANGGTLFLDEVGETSLGCQVKLLRVLQEGRARRLGSTREHKLDARIVAASNRDLLQAVEAESFRRDLFFRLNVLPISLPPRPRRGHRASGSELPGTERETQRPQDHRARCGTPARDLCLARQRKGARERGCADCCQRERRA
jgi:transcriptional regulator of acetoin/glycerol metabolism